MTDKTDKPELHYINSAYFSTLMATVGWKAERLESIRMPNGKFAMTENELKELALNIARVERREVIDYIIAGWRKIWNK